MKSLLDPVVLFFILGAAAGVLKSGLRVPAILLSNTKYLSPVIHRY
jgi:hypothetical protein